MSSSKLLDSLETSVKGLKREKTCLEQKFKVMKSQKKSLQIKVDGMITKRNQLMEINAKMKETLSVAQHKVSHTQEQQNAIQNFVDEKRKKQSEILETIEEERQTQMTESAKFEEDLSGLASLFMSAQKYYKLSNLENELASSDEQQRHLVAQSGQYSRDMEDLGEQLKQLYLENEERTIAANKMCIPPIEQQELVCQFDQWNQSTQKKYTDLGKTHESLLVELETAEKMLQ